jgi:hypothetical protein
LVQFFQDFVSPFYLFTKAIFTSTFSYSDNSYAPQKLIINSEIETKVMNYTIKKVNFELELKDHSMDIKIDYTVSEDPTGDVTFILHIPEHYKAIGEGEFRE